MQDLFQECAEVVRRLHSAVQSLEERARLLQLPAPTGLEWHESLRQKLLPQLGDHAYLVVAVVGGTNIGKSTIFNHLAGFAASSVSPLASGTRHPVCLMPPRFAEQHDLTKIFADFQLKPWSDPALALSETPDDLLFWRESPNTPENLLILDTPDIDSDAPVNWDRADKIRRSADVLIAILTQQKYNDAAVKKFFRRAAADDKSILIVFNQCDLPDDEQYWPMWVEKFCSETDILPEYVYLTPRDKKASLENRLPFYERTWPADGEQHGDTSSTSVEHSLKQNLSQLHFADIKLRTLRGSLRHLLDEEQGVPQWLETIRQRSSVFRSATEHLAADRMAGSERWPTVPNAVLVDVIRVWWRERREGWSRSIHEFYNGVGEKISWPFKKLWQSFNEPPEPPLEIYRKREWSAMLETVERVYDRLDFISQTENPILAQKLGDLLNGKSRQSLLKQLEERHSKIDFEFELRDLVSHEMERFQDESPNFYKFLKRLDQLGAAIRPATSVALFVIGFGPAGDAAAQLFAHGAMHTVVDVAGGTAAAAVGDTAISSTASSLSATLEAHFRALHNSFAAKRVGWLLTELQTHLWGDFLEELKAGALVPEDPAFLSVLKELDELRRCTDVLELSAANSSLTKSSDIPET